MAGLDGLEGDSARIVRAWRELRRGAQAAVLRAHLLGADGPRLEQAQLDALEVLAAEPGGCRMSEFAEALRIDPSSATRAVDRLVQLRLAERVAGPDDKRVVIARATAAGRRTVARVSRLRAAGMARLLEPFDETERAQLAELLERFVESVDELVAELQRDDPVRRGRNGAR